MKSYSPLKRLCFSLNPNHPIFMLSHIQLAEVPQTGDPPTTMPIDPPHPLVVDQHLLLAIDFPIHI